MQNGNQTIFQKLFSVIESRKRASASESYTAGLMQKGAVKINEKIMEEAREVCEAGLQDDRAHLIHEIADLFFHTLVLAAHKDSSLTEIEAELERRFGKSGLDEKAGRKDKEKKG